MTTPSTDRPAILLKAAYDLLMKQRKTNDVLYILDETVRYDNAECDGYTLLEDIKIELDLPD